MKALTNKELTYFCSQMALILKSGISSTEGLSLMLEDYGLLTFTSSPETKGAHRISVTLNTADGRSFSASMDYEFN